MIKLWSIRSSRPDVFCKKGVLRNFAKFTGKHLCQSLFFNKVAGLSPATLLKKRLWHRCFPGDFVKLLRTLISTEHLWWLFLSFSWIFSGVLAAPLFDHFGGLAPKELSFIWKKCIFIVLNGSNQHFRKNLQHLSLKMQTASRWLAWLK